MGKSEGIEIGFVPPTLHSTTTIELGSRLTTGTAVRLIIIIHPHTISMKYIGSIWGRRRRSWRSCRRRIRVGDEFIAPLFECADKHRSQHGLYVGALQCWLAMSWEEARVGIVFIHSCSSWSGAFSCDNHVLECLVWSAWALSLSFVLFCNNNKNHHRSIRSVLFTRRDYHP